MQVVFFVGLIILIIAVGAIGGSRRKIRIRARAEANYRRSLTGLRQSPANVALREQTLALGRVYSGLTRNNQGIAIFDEVALMNDINAACGAAAAHSLPVENKQFVPNVEQRLIKLSELKRKGLITEEEYNSGRGKILDEV